MILRAADFDNGFGDFVATVPADQRWAVIATGDATQVAKVEAYLLTPTEITLVLNYRGRIQYFSQDNPKFLGVVGSPDPSHIVIDWLRKCRQNRSLEAV